MSLFLLQVIQFIDNDAEGKRSNNSIVVIKSKSDLKYQIKGIPNPFMMVLFDLKSTVVAF